VFQITFTSYFDITHPTVQIAPTFISKINTGVQLSLVSVTLMAAVLPSYDFQTFLLASWYARMFLYELRVWKSYIALLILMLHYISGQLLLQLPSCQHLVTYLPKTQ